LVKDEEEKNELKTWWVERKIHQVCIPALRSKLDRISSWTKVPQTTIFQ